MTMRRTARGKRPQFSDPAMDQAMAMIMVLAQEHNVLRDRLDTLELVATAHGLSDAIEAYQPPQQVLEARETRRQAFFARLFYLARKDAAEARDADSSETYADTLSAIAKG